MPLSVADIKRNNRTFKFDFVLARSVDGVGVDGTETYETIEVAYRPSMMTPDFDQRILDLQLDAKTANGMWMAEYMAQVVVKWDVVEEDGTTMVPITVDRLRSLPNELLAAVIIEVAKDAGKDQVGSRTG